MKNTILSALLIPTFIALYLGGIKESLISCAIGLVAMSFIVVNVLIQKK